MNPPQSASDWIVLAIVWLGALPVWMYAIYHLGAFTVLYVGLALNRQLSRDVLLRPWRAPLPPRLKVHQRKTLAAIVVFIGLCGLALAVGLLGGSLQF